MKAVIWLAVLVFVCVPGIAQSSAIPLLEVPSGTAPTLDGTLANTEWVDALALDLSEATTLYVKHSGGFLYVGVRAPSDAQVIGNVYIARGEAIEILHASHAPGPASYLLGEETWRLAQPFLWSCRTLGFSEAALAERATFLEGNGWVATVVNLGRPEEMEYQIRVAETPCACSSGLTFIETPRRSSRGPLTPMSGSPPEHFQRRPPSTLRRGRTSR